MTALHSCTARHFLRSKEDVMDEDIVHIELAVRNAKKTIRLTIRLPISHAFVDRTTKLMVDISDQNNDTYTLEIERNGEKRSSTYVGIKNGDDTEEIRADMLPKELKDILKNLGIDL